MNNSKRSVLMQRFELGKFLGQGNFAKVYQARNIRTGDNVAIKVIDKEKVLKAGLMDQIKREISITSMVKHPNIVEIYEVMATKTKVYIVMEYVKGGELFRKIAKGRLKEEVARKYFQQLISAVDYCHSRGVFHRDLKPENLLLDEDGNLKVSDFGLSACADCRRQDGLLHTACGTPSYVSPEVIGRKGYDGAKSDVWSCGVILFVLLAGYLPFHDPNLIEMYRKIKKAEFKCPRWFPSEVRRLLSKILDPNPATRISAGKIMESSWFRRGFMNKSEKTEAEPTTTQMADDEILSSCDDVGEAKEMMKMTNLNAFDIISLASGLELSGLFEDADRKNEKKFTSKQTASTILSELENISKRLKLNVMKKGGFVKLQRSKEGRKGALAIDAEIFQITPDFHLVEIRKTSGDTLEYQKMWQQHIRPSLKDIVWAWQGETKDDLEEQNGQQ